MEASEMLRSVRSRGGLSQTELARMAEVAPSTVSRIERGELEPTWSMVNRLLEAVGYQPAGGLTSKGDVSAVAAARTVLGEKVGAERDDVRAWVDRWMRARFVDAAGRAEDVEKIGVQAGNASRVFDRPNARRSVVYDRAWQDIATDLATSGVGYAVTGITATSPTRVTDGAAWPIIYVDSIEDAVAAGGLVEQTTAGPRITLIAFDETASAGTVLDGGFIFVSPAQALIDSYAGPGRMADQADAVASRWQASLVA
jgi:transcriptional regulator with XRE-family HTH domain